MKQKQQSQTFAKSRKIKITRKDGCRGTIACLQVFFPGKEVGGVKQYTATHIR